MSADSEPCTRIGQVMTVSACTSIGLLQQTLIIVHIPFRYIGVQWKLLLSSNEAAMLYISASGHIYTSIRESVDSLCRDDVDMPMPPYIRKACNRLNAAFVSLFR